mgnify:CR=1 FL=1
MEDKILILPVDSQTFQIEDYSIEDVSLISTIELDTEFSQSTDYIEYYIFDENKNQIFPRTTKELLTYTIRDGHVLLSPKQDLQREEFDEGIYYINYNFYKKQLNSSIESKYYIQEISSDRTEIRLNSNTISNEDIQSSTEKFIEYRNTKDYFVDFYLNFGNNNLIISNNIKLDVVDEGEYSILIKLYEPLPADFDIKSQCWVVETISTPQSYQVQFPIEVFDPQDFEYIAGPNLDLNIKNESGVSSQEFSYSTLLNSNITSSNSQIQNLLEDKGLKINVNYEDFTNYIKFSSAKTRLENFVYKVKLIENYQSQITTLDSNITSNTNLTSEFSSSTSIFNLKIKDIVNNLDPYERFLYFNSGSAYSYPKTSTQPPYTLYPSTSVEVKTWLGSNNPNDGYYGGLALQAYEYDQNNQDYLYWNIPEYLRDDPNNAQYDLFIDMVGQHFDNIWIYTKDVVNKFDADNRLDYGISKDLVADAIKDFGIKLYSNNFNTNDLYEAFLGITPNGINFPTTGSELINNQISASSDIIPLDDTNKRLYKRIYHNIPYLLKTKGTIAGLRALITSYGIPDTILRINEFGSKNKINKQDWDYKQNVYNYALHLDGNSYLSSSFEINNNFSTDKPNTIQFRFKTPGLPTTPLSQSLFSIGTNGDSILLLEYTGSSNGTGSYSGSISDPYNEYGTIKFIPSKAAPSTFASISLPIFDGEWWSIMATQNDITASLYGANQINNNLGFTASNSIVGYNASPYNSGTKIHFPHYADINVGSKIYKPFTGSIQEIRYYVPNISTSSFEDYTLNPYSFKGNDITSNELAFRADLGSLSSTSSLKSIHPKVTGSWELTSSFSSGDSNFYISNPSFVVNREYIYQNQAHYGIKNKINDKISIFENIVPPGDTLSSQRSVQQYSYLTQSTTPDADYLEVAFSPSNQINDDITAELGNFNIGDYIGDPRHISESRTNYPDLDKLRDQYFLKYIKSYDVKDFIRLIKYFDNSLFKMIKDFTPARTNLSSGVVVKQHILERNAYSPTIVSHEDQTYSGSVKSFARGYSTGSGDTGTYETVGGSTIEVFKGGTGGIFERFNSLDFYKSGSDGNGPDNRFGITQSWFDVFPSTGSQYQRYDRDDQREFYNGEFSQSMYLKMQRGKDYKDDDPCYDYLNWENVPELLYRLEFFSGSDNLFRVEPFTPIPPIVLTEYYTNYLQNEGDDGEVSGGQNACVDASTINIFTNVDSITSIVVGTTMYSDIDSVFPWTGSTDSTIRFYGLREKNIVYTILNTSGSNYFANLCEYSADSTSTPIPYTGSKFTGSYNNTNITYSDVSTYSGYQTGINATFDIVTNTGSIISINANNIGSGYSVSNTLDFNSSDLGGSRLTTINHRLGVTNAGTLELNNLYGTGSFALQPSATTSTSTNVEWELQFNEYSSTPTPRKGPLNRLSATNVGEGVKVGDTFTWTSIDINKHIQATIGAPIVSTANTLLASITTQPDGVAIGQYLQVGLTGSLNGREAEATFDLDAVNNISGLTVTTTGSGYVKNEIITIPSASLGATLPGGTDAIITLTSTDLDLDYISNGTGNYVFTVPANGINTNANHLDEDIVTLKLKNDNFNYSEEPTVNKLRVAINGNGVITNVFACKFKNYFRLKQTGTGTFENTIEIPIEPGYSVGNFVSLSIAGCWEIIQIIFTPSPAPFDPPTISGLCTPSTPTLYPVSLAFGSNKTIACAAAESNYQMDSEYFCQATTIYNMDNTVAGEGFYSFSSIVARFQNSNGSLDECVACSSNTYTGIGVVGSGGGQKIICNELYRQGFLTEEMWDADERFGEMMFEKDPKLVIGYQMWACKVVKYIRKYPQHTKYLYILAKPWTEYMGYEMGIIDKQNYIGKILQKLGSLPTYLLFYLGGGKKLLNYINHKRFLKNIG